MTTAYKVLRLFSPLDVDFSAQTKYGNDHTIQKYGDFAAPETVQPLRNTEMSTVYKVLKRFSPGTFLPRRNMKITTPYKKQYGDFAAPETFQRRPLTHGIGRAIIKRPTVLRVRRRRPSTHRIGRVLQ